jgi:hypothetical protein
MIWTRKAWIDLLLSDSEVLRATNRHLYIVQQIFGVGLFAAAVAIGAPAMKAGWIMVSDMGSSVAHAFGEPYWIIAAFWLVVVAGVFCAVVAKACLALVRWLNT